jgi:hypothetical protein
MTTERRSAMQQPVLRAPRPVASPAHRTAISTLVESAQALDAAIRAYHESGGTYAANGAEPMAEAFAAFVQRLLPAAPCEVHAGIVQLCVLETVKERLEAEASRVHAAGPARVLDIRSRR